MLSAMAVSPLVIVQKCTTRRWSVRASARNPPWGCPTDSAGYAALARRTVVPAWLRKPISANRGRAGMARQVGGVG
jgi:hypothetical protein